MRVVTIDRASPKVLGYFALATEIFDDSGSRKSTISDIEEENVTRFLAHTLEHLIFMVNESTVNIRPELIRCRRVPRVTSIKDF